MRIRSKFQGRQRPLPGSASHIPSTVYRHHSPIPPKPLAALGGLPKPKPEPIQQPKTSQKFKPSRILTDDDYKSLKGSVRGWTHKRIKSYGIPMIKGWRDKLLKDYERTHPIAYENRIVGPRKVKEPGWMKYRPDSTPELEDLLAHEKRLTAKWYSFISGQATPLAGEAYSLACEMDSLAMEIDQMIGNKELKEMNRERFSAY